MCGIVGYIGYKKAQPILIKSLKKLEYRGYDSCGIAIANGKIEVLKDVGRIQELEKRLPQIGGKRGIGHTRWATHGTPSQANAHPHLDCQGKIAVVHNGVIENFHTLKQKLIGEGHHFASETDTEVISHLIEKYYQGNLEEAITKAVNELSGSFAIIVLEENSRKLVAVRQENPLIIGIGDKENFIASDVPALLEYTDRIIYLEDGDMAVVSDEEIKITNGRQAITRLPERVPWTLDEAQKSGYEHFMLKEIHEQPKAVTDTFKGYLSATIAEINLGIREVDFRDILFLGCGSSYYASLVGEYVIGKLCQIPVRVRIASEFSPAETRLDKTWVIAITQSGETADTLKALKKAKETGYPTLAITNVVGSSVTRIADQTFYIRAGPEISVAATKSFLAQLTALYLLALALAPSEYRIKENLIRELKHIPVRIQQVLDEEANIAQLAGYLSQYNNVFFIARGINYPVALEGALKLKEIAYIHAEAYAAGELKHGPFALLRSNTPVIALAPRDDTYEALLTNVKEVKARGTRVIALGEEGDENLEQFVDHVIHLPKVEPILSPFTYSVALQLLAYYTAKERGCEIDLPLNLAKSVTVP